MITNKESRYAHSEGHTDLCFDDSGSHWLTGGSDGDIRVWKGLDDDDPESHRVGDKVYSVLCKNDRFYTASDDNAVKAHMMSTGQPDGIVTRFTAPVTHMQFNSSGTKLVAGSSDFMIKIVTVDTSEQTSLVGHEAPILSIALHPEEKYVASASCDGTVKIWDPVNGREIHSLQVLPKSNDFSIAKTLARISWDKKGKYLFVPVEKEVKVYDTGTWNTVFTLDDSNITHNLSILDVSPCGRFVAGSCVNGHMSVWHLNSKKCLLSEKHDKGFCITAMAWLPNGHNELAYCDNQGNVSKIELDLDVGMETALDADAVAIATTDDLDGLFDDDDDNDLVTQSEAMEMDGDDDDEDIGRIKRKSMKLIEGLEDDDSNMSKDTGSVVDGKKPEALVAPVIQPVYKGPDFAALQRPFQPGSTPEHLSHRFMVWNAVGIVHQYNTDEENSIDIEFHDTATHHALHVANTLNHTMADLSHEAVFLACQSDTESPSKLMCMHFSSWDSSKEWIVPMPDGEEIQTVTLGGGWGAVATSRRMVRIFTIGGIQKEIVSIPGPVVAMCGHENQLLVTYHRGTALPGDQCLGYKLFHVNKPKMVSMVTDHLPLSAKSTLVWLGFSAEGTGFMCDSAGIVRMMNQHFGNTWVEVADTKAQGKGKSDNYFVISVHENPQQLRAVLCKGSRYPPTLPRPMVSILPFQIPLCDITADKGQMEESYWRSRLFSQHLERWTAEGYEVDEDQQAHANMAQQEALMKLFALACKTEREFRAVELCEMMPGSHTVQLAIKYATRLRLLQLAQRLSDVASGKAEEEADVEEVYVQPARRSVSTRCAVQEQQEAASEGEDEVDEADVSKDIYEEIEEEEEEAPKPKLFLKMKSKDSDSSSPTLQPKSLSLSQAARKNPFKVGGSQKGSQASSGKGSQVFDSLPKASTSKSNPLAAAKTTDAAKDKKKKGNTQMKLFAPVKSKETTATKNDENAENKPVEKRTAFQVWFEENKSDLEEEHPNVANEDLTMVAAKTFKALPDDQRKVWAEKAKGGAPPSGEDKKRKRDDGEVLTAKRSKDDSAEGKKKLSNTTNSKLAGFAFGQS